MAEHRNDGPEAEKKQIADARLAEQLSAAKRQQELTENVTEVLKDQEKAEIIQQQRESAEENAKLTASSVQAAQAQMTLTQQQAAAAAEKQKKITEENDEANRVAAIAKAIERAETAAQEARQAAQAARAARAEANALNNRLRVVSGKLKQVEQQQKQQAENLLQAKELEAEAKKIAQQAEAARIEAEAAAKLASQAIDPAKQRAKTSTVKADQVAKKAAKKIEKVRKRLTEEQEAHPGQTSNRLERLQRAAARMAQIAEVAKQQAQAAAEDAENTVKIAGQKLQVAAKALVTQYEAQSKVTFAGFSTKHARGALEETERLKALALAEFVAAEVAVSEAMKKAEEAEVKAVEAEKLSVQANENLIKENPLGLGHLNQPKENLSLEPAQVAAPFSKTPDPIDDAMSKAVQTAQLAARSRLAVRAAETKWAQASRQLSEQKKLFSERNSQIEKDIYNILLNQLAQSKSSPDPTSLKPELVQKESDNLPLQKSLQELEQINKEVLSLAIAEKEAHNELILAKALSQEHDLDAKTAALQIDDNTAEMIKQQAVDAAAQVDQEVEQEVEEEDEDEMQQEALTEEDSTQKSTVAKSPVKEVEQVVEQVEDAAEKIIKHEPVEVLKENLTKEESPVKEKVEQVVEHIENAAEKIMSHKRPASPPVEEARTKSQDALSMNPKPGAKKSDKEKEEEQKKYETPRPSPFDQ